MLLHDTLDYSARENPDVPFAVELNEWDDYNKPDPIGAIECDVDQVCKFPLGMVTVRSDGPVAAPPPPQSTTQAGSP